MSRPAPDRFFPPIILDYLNDPASVEAGVPLDSALPKVVFGAGTVQKTPAFILMGHELPGGHGARRTIQVEGGLIFKVRSAGPDAATDAKSLERSVEFIEASRLLESLGARMSDFSALGAFIAALDDSSRDGFRILKMQRVTPPAYTFEKGQPSATLYCALKLEIIWYQQTA